MKKRILLSVLFIIMMCMFCTTVNGAGITDFYTLIDQNTNKPVREPVVWIVDDEGTNGFGTLQGHIFQEGDQIIFNSILRESGNDSPDTKFEGFNIINGNGGPNITSTLATINEKSDFDASIARKITFTSKKPVILHSYQSRSLVQINNVNHMAFSLRHGKYEEYYPIEYENATGAVLQYGGPQIAQAYITDDYYDIKFYDTYVKEGYHFNSIGVYNQTGQHFEAIWEDPSIYPSVGGVTTLKTRVKKSNIDGNITPGKMIVTISMETGYTLKLDATGGKIDYIDSKIFEIDSKYSDINLSDYNEPIREGYTFDGWYRDTECTKPAIETTSFDDEMYDRGLAADAYNLTYYAKWTPTAPENTHTITINSGTGFTTDLTSPKMVNKNDDLEISITAKTGYKLTSVKIDNVEQTLPLTNNKIVLTDISKNMEILVVAEEIIYNFDDDSKDLTYTIGTDEELSLRVEDATIDDFDKVFINDKLLDSKHYTVESGSIIVKLKDSYLKTLKNGTYSIKVLTKDGGKAVSSFVIANSSVKDESNPKTGDGIMISIIIGSVSLIGLLGISTYLNKKRFN